MATEVSDMWGLSALIFFLRHTVQRGTKCITLHGELKWLQCKLRQYDGCCPSYFCTLKRKNNTARIVTDLPMSNLFFRHCVWSKNLTLSQAWMKQRPPLWRKHITSQFLDNFQRAVTAKMKLFERQLGEQIWFVTMIPATYAASYWNAFQNCAANARRPSA